MERTARIVFYAVDGPGLGHLMRLVAIARWIRRYTAHMGVRSEIYFLSSSEADGLLAREQLASFKLPSKAAAANGGIDKLTYLALAKQWSWHSLSLLRPDLLVVDALPHGAFGELTPALDLCQKRAFIYPTAREGLADRPEIQAALPLYDAIVVPDEEPEARVTFSESVRRRVRHVGPILVRERAELLSREAARAHLQIGEGEFAVYVSAGGGGEPAAEQQLAWTVAELRSIPDLCIVVGAGPLFRGRRVHEGTIRWMNEPTAAELMLGFDLAVCAAGYNTYHELMHAGVPAVFLPLSTPSDPQGARATRAARAGAAIVIDRLDDGGALRRAVQRFLNPAVRAGAAEAARTLVPRNHARDAAAELLRLILSSAWIDAAEDAISDDLLGAARDLNLPIELIIEVMHALSPPERNGGGRERAFATADERAKTAGEHATDLLWFAAMRDIPPACAARLSAAFAQKLPAATPEGRAAATQELLLALLPFNDWTGAATLLRLLCPEATMSAEAFTGELVRFLAELRKRGADLYRAIALFSAGQGSLADAPSNEEMLRAARAELASPTGTLGDAASGVDWDSETTSSLEATAAPTDLGPSGIEKPSSSS